MAPPKPLPMVGAQLKELNLKEIKAKPETKPILQSLRESLEHIKKTTIRDRSNSRNSTSTGLLEKITRITQGHRSRNPAKKSASFTFAVRPEIGMRSPERYASLDSESSSLLAVNSAPLGEMIFLFLCSFLAVKCNFGDESVKSETSGTLDISANGTLFLAMIFLYKRNELEINVITLIINYTCSRVDDEKSGFHLSSIYSNRIHESLEKITLESVGLRIAKTCMIYEVGPIKFQGFSNKSAEKTRLKSYNQKTVIKIMGVLRRC